MLDLLVRMPGDRSPTTDLWQQLPSLTLGISQRMAPANSFELADYNEILVAHEQGYRRSKGNARQEIITEIMQAISGQSEGKLSKEVMRGMPSVSYLVKCAML